MYTVYMGDIGPCFHVNIPSTVNRAISLSIFDLNIPSSIHPASTYAFITLPPPFLLTSFFIYSYLSKSSTLSSIILIRFCVIVLIIIHMSIIDLSLFQSRMFNCLHPLLVLNEYTGSTFIAHYTFPRGQNRHHCKTEFVYKWFDHYNVTMHIVASLRRQNKVKIDIYFISLILATLNDCSFLMFLLHN